MFVLAQRFQSAHPTDFLESAEIQLADNHVDSDVAEWFEIDKNGSITVENRSNLGTVGVADDTAPEPCPSKLATGNRVLKAQFGRRRTHNEQTLVRPCGIIYARATMFGAEAVSNFLVCLFSQEADLFSVRAINL